MTALKRIQMEMMNANEWINILSRLIGYMRLKSWFPRARRKSRKIGRFTYRYTRSADRNWSFSQSLNCLIINLRFEIIRVGFVSNRCRSVHFFLLTIPSTAYYPLFSSPNKTKCFLFSSRLAESICREYCTVRLIPSQISLVSRFSTETIVSFCSGLLT